MERIAAVILAAGGSFRLGRPKQFLVYQGLSLVRRAIEAALGGGCSPVVVVAGRDTERVAREATMLPTTVIGNPDWERGIGSSIRVGVSAVLEIDPDGQAILIMTCDQPLVNAETVGGLLAHRAMRRGTIIASAYEETAGVPALFDRVHFSRLQKLPDEQGAKHLIRANPSQVIEVPVPEGAIDIDTMEDYSRLVSG